MFTLHNGDCLEYMKTLQPASVDTVITDPPYSSGGQFRGDRTKNTNTKYLGTSKYQELPENITDFGGDNRDQRSWAFWCMTWLSECFRIMKPGGLAIVFTDWRQLPSLTDAYQGAGFVWRGVGVWDKTWASSRPMAGRFMHQAEYFVWGTKGALPFDFSKDCLPGVFSIPTEKMTDRVHPTQKPVELIKQFIRISGDVVIDPFMGGGTVGVACVQTGKDFVGCEADPKYFAVAEKRIKSAVFQPSFFTPSNNRLHLTGGTVPLDGDLLTPGLFPAQEV
jgi:site-specific DNA-methyltransferase (adenine-specific)